MASNSDLLELYASLRRNLALEAASFLKDMDFSLRQFLILRNLGVAGPLTMTALAEFCMTDAATISRSICQLVDAGYVRKSQCPEDGRIWRAELCPKGKKLLPRLEAVHRDLADHCFSTLTADENRQFASLLSKVIKGLESRRAVPGELRESNDKMSTP